MLRQTGPGRDGSAAELIRLLGVIRHDRTGQRETPCHARSPGTIHGRLARSRSAFFSARAILAMSP
jgi:hypothetical protein